MWLMIKISTNIIKYHNFHIVDTKIKLSTTSYPISKNGLHTIKKSKSIQTHLILKLRIKGYQNQGWDILNPFKISHRKSKKWRSK